MGPGAKHSQPARGQQATYGIVQAHCSVLRHVEKVPQSTRARAGMCAYRHQSHILLVEPGDRHQCTLCDPVNTLNATLPVTHGETFQSLDTSTAYPIGSLDRQTQEICAY
jgi:hypothetical protein